MQSIHHNYSPSWFMKGYAILFDVLGLLFPMYLFLSAFTIANHKQLPITVDGILKLFIFAILAGSSFLIAGNFFNEITSDEDGLHTSFFWKHLIVPWEEIIDVKPLFNVRFLKHFSVIRTRSLTPFHRLYGLIYSFTISPSIIYSKGMSNYAELNRRVNSSVRKNRITKQIPFQ